MVPEVYDSCYHYVVNYKLTLEKLQETTEVTTHFMGQSTVTVDGERATGETYCIARHVSAFEGIRTLFYCFSSLL